MKLTRVIQLKKKDETLTLEMEVPDSRTLNAVDFMEQRIKEIDDYLKGDLTVPKSTPKKKEEKMGKGLFKEKIEGTAFDSIPLDSEDFNLYNTEITRIGEEQTGPTKSGGVWYMRSITIKDPKGKLRDLIAWGDHRNLFAALKVGDMLDIDSLSEVSEYTNKRGQKTIQYTVSESTEIRGAE